MGFKVEMKMWGIMTAHLKPHVSLYLNNIGQEYSFYLIKCLIQEVIYESKRYPLLPTKEISGASELHI